MTIEADLYTALTGDGALAALVGARVYPNRAPRDATTPFIAYRRVSATRTSSMGVDDGIVRSRFQFDIFAGTHLAATGVRDALRAVLQRWRKTTGTVVQDTFVLNQQDLFDDEAKLHHLADDFEIIHEEAV